MKHLLVFLFLLCSVSVSAQDVIVKKDGSTILSKVLEVGQEEIKYKKFDNLEGPTYTIQKSELQAINYQNGAKDTFSTPVREENRYLPNNQNDGEQQMNDRALLVLDHEMQKQQLKKNKMLKTVGWIMGGSLATGGAILYGISDNDSKGKVVGPLMIVSGAVCTTTFIIVANQMNNKSLSSYSLYQRDIPFTNGSSLSLGADLLSDRTLGCNTIGLGLRYNF